jgi:CheY-like chemotaxis protein/anti-sigma regulatory factor (Ser/Thr protein kinase)
LHFVADLDDGLLCAVRADERKLRQVLINVLGNAVKFTTQGEVRLRIRHEREMAQFDIEDTGPGIAAPELERIFEPFARGAGAAQGSGLGLTIARMLTDLMGGEMSVRSTPGEGSCFRIRLFLPRQREPAGLAAEGARRLGFAGRPRRVLVVDNEEVDRELLRQLLEPVGFETRAAASGEEALGLLRAMASGESEAAWRPDAILMDLAMPGIDGWETIRRARAEGLATAPIAIVSANAFDRTLDNDAGIRPADFLLKPVRHEELLDWLGRVLALEWRTAGSLGGQTDASAPPLETTLPSAASLRGLAEQVQAGYPRGIHRWLDHIEATEPACAAFTQHLRALAAQFRLDAMAQTIVAGLRQHEATHG